MIGWSDELAERSRFTRIVANQPITVEQSADGELSARSEAADRAVMAIRRKHRILWLWFGDAAQADPTTIPDFSCFDSVVETAFFAGYLPTQAHYELLTDNILDLSHADYLHPATLGGMMTQSAVSIERDGDSIVTVWDSPNGRALPILESLLPEPGQPAHVRLGVRWDPASVMLLWVDLAPAGTPLENGFRTNAAHIMTPESEYRTHYFYGGSRNWQVDDAAYNAFLAQATGEAFATEDKPMIEAQQREMGCVDFWDMRPALLPIDKGPILARRALARLIREELEHA